MAELTEVVTDAAEEVASVAVRSFSGKSLAIGLVVGAAVGAGVAFLWTRRKLEKKYEQIAEEEIDAMREHFRARLVAREEKPDLGGLEVKAQELGYSTPAGPRPAPPEADPTAVEPRPPVPVPPRARGRTAAEAMEEAQDRDAALEMSQGRDPFEGWNYDEELAKRDHAVPYVIHFDERGEADFDSLTYTYYEADDVVCDEADKALGPRDEIVGDHNLNRFGHGSGDPNVVYVRNDKLALEIEIVRNPGSYTEEVRGIQHQDGGIERRRRRPPDETD